MYFETEDAADLSAFGPRKKERSESFGGVVQGNFRIAYLIDDEAGEVTTYKTGDRKDVCR